MVTSAGAAEFRLALLSPGGHDPEQHFPAGEIVTAKHAPVNFHGYAACTGGAFFRDTGRAIASGWPVLLLLRGNFRAATSALKELQKAKRPTCISLKETGAHQIAEQLSDPARLERFTALVRAADGCVAATPEAADLFQHFGARRAEFIPTPYPMEEERWNWTVSERAGIFVGTREWDVPSRNHLAALLAAKNLSHETKEPVTVFNLDGRRGARLIAAIGFERIRVHTGRMNYRAYLGVMARHKIVLQYDRSQVPGQVAGDTLLCRGLCVGGNGAIERIAFTETCGESRSDRDLFELALHLLRHEDVRSAAAARATQMAEATLPFGVGRENLARLFGGLPRR
ncbi:MAG: hypothetical protein ABI839_05345 [Verrucomicrobiota bacterium]